MDLGPGRERGGGLRPCHSYRGVSSRPAPPCVRLDTATARAGVWEAAPWLEVDSTPRKETPTLFL